MKFTTLAHKIKVLFDDMSEQLMNLFICQLQKKLSSWLTETHLITNHNPQNLDQFNQFYKWLNQSYYNVILNITCYKRYHQQINQKASISPVTGLSAARSLEPIWHDPPHHKLHWATVPTHLNECWRCGEPDHFSKDCTKPQADKSVQIKKIEF